MQFVNIDVDTTGLYQVPTSDKGTVAIVGVGTGSGSLVPVKLGSYAEVDAIYPTDSELSLAIKLAFENGASGVWAVEIDDPKSLTGVENALEVLETKDVQIVVLANTVELSDTAYISSALDNHVASSVTERVGVFMLASGEDASTMPAAIGNLMSQNTTRLIGIAHNTTSDVAAAVAGLLAGLDPWDSPVMKPLSGISTPSADFTTTQFSLMDAANINPIFDPLYFAGTSLVLKSGYTLGTRAGGIYLVDVRRAIDDIVYKLKTGLTSPAVIGNLRINKSGMASLRNHINSIMQAAVNLGEIDSFAVNIPVATALAVDQNARTPTQATIITTARTNRAVDVTVAIEYSGAIHTLNMTVAFSA